MSAKSVSRRTLHVLLSAAVAIAAILTLSLMAAAAPTRAHADLIAAQAGEVQYLHRGWNGSEVVQSTGVRKDYSVVDSNTEHLSGWYVVNSNLSLDGRLIVDDQASIILCDGARLYLKNGINVSAGKTLNIYAQSSGTGELYCDADINDNAAIGADNEDGDCGTVNIFGGVVTADTKTLGTDGAGIGGGDQGNGGRVVIYGGTVKAYGANLGAGIGGGDRDSNKGGNNGTTVIYGGDVTAVGGNNAAGIGGGEEGNGGTVEIYGGKVNATGGSSNVKGGAGIGGGGLGNAGTIKIHGGDVTAKGGANAAGIGGSDEGASGEIVITGGKVNATGGSEYSDGGAGIGGGNERGGGTITITGGEVTAQGGCDAAGVGGGDAGAGGVITIRSASINATGGKYGAGIGGGQGGAGGTIAINGASTTVTAKGGAGAAGIGGGEKGAGGAIAIADGTIIAAGNDNGAGIGGGLKGNSGDITITGGTINASCREEAAVDGKEGNGGAGIGGGSDGNVDHITINGGDITAVASFKGAGIGGGDEGSCGVIKITGGTVKAFGMAGATKAGGAGIGSGEDCSFTGEQSITISGGDIAAHTDVDAPKLNPQAADRGEIQVQVSGGAGTGSGSDDGGSGAAIGSGRDNAKNNIKITITGCERLVAISGKRAAGIGGGYKSNGGTIEISADGKSVTAKGGESAAGIGGGFRGDGGTITLNGGIIDATGGSTTAGDDHIRGAAGIGGGYRGTSGTITINGGTIKARCDGYSGAGIGSGSECDTKEGAINITINGGTVEATGSKSYVKKSWSHYPGAAIGAGGRMFFRGGDDTDSYFAGDIYFNGGSVTAKAADFANEVDANAPYNRFEANNDSNYCNVIGTTDEEGLDGVTGNVHFNGATVRMEAKKDLGGTYSQAVRASNVSIKDDATTHVRVVSDGAVALKDDRNGVLASTGKQLVVVEPCTHESATRVDKDAANHHCSCPHCGFDGDEAHVYDESVAWAWSDDNAKASATSRCVGCGHEKVFEAAVTMKEGDKTKCIATVTIGGKTYTDQVDRLVYPITKAECENGSIEVAGSAVAGSTVAVTATPAEHYHVKAVTVNGRPVAARGGAYSFEMPRADAEVAAAFELDKVRVTWRNDDGSELCAENVDYGAVPAYKGAQPAKPADALSGYRFAGWEPGAAPATADVSYTATYEETWPGESPYAGMVNGGVVNFAGAQWYVIADDSVNATKGTVTLLSKNVVEKGVQFDSRRRADKGTYAQSKIRAKLDGMTAEGGRFEGVADLIADTDLPDVGVTGAKLFLLSYGERGKLTDALKRCDADWWTRTARNGGVWAQRSAAGQTPYRPYPDQKCGLRPALRLDLSKVGFDAGTATFLPAQQVSAPAPAEGLSWTGGEQQLLASPAAVVSGNAEGGVAYSLDGKTWGAELPRASAAGDYTVRYRVEGNAAFAPYEGAVRASIAPRAWADFTYSISLEDSIDVNFHMRNLADDPSAYTVAYGEGERQTGEWTVAVPTDAASNAFTVASRAAKEMGDEVHVIVRHRGEVVKDAYYSAKGYCDAVIASDHDGRLKDLCRAALNYGARAQETFGYKGGGPADGGAAYFPNAVVGLPAYGAVKADASGAVEGATLSLVTEAKTRLVARFSCGAAGAAGFSATVDGRPAALSAEGGRLKVVVEGIAARDLGARRHIVVTDPEGGTYALTASPVDYMALAVERGSNPETNRALYDYHLKAREYFEASQGQ